MRKKTDVGFPATKNWVVATQIFFIFTPKLGEDEPILTSIFFKWGCFNHQPENLGLLGFLRCFVGENALDRGLAPVLHQNAGEWEGNHQEKGNRDTLGPPPHPASQCIKNLCIFL